MTGETVAAAGVPSRRDIIAVVVTYNSESHIEPLLDTLQGTVDGTVIVDNASVDSTVKLAKAHPSAPLILRNARNVGLARAVNRAIQYFGDADVLLLNPDIVVTPGSIAELATTLDRMPDVGIAAPVLKYPTGEPQGNARRFPSLWTLVMNRTSLGGTSAGRRWVERDRHASSESRVVYVDWALGACLLIRHEALRQLEGMDGRYFLYCEDVDLCARAWQCGWEVVLVPSSEVVHEYQRDSKATWDLRRKTTRAHWVSLLKMYRRYPSMLVDSRRISDKHGLPATAGE